jgi:nucleoside-diphosphate-sugar epimerase
MRILVTGSFGHLGDALIPPNGAPAAWITEEIIPVPKNIYGVTKAAAEDLCQLFHRNQRLTCIILRTSRFFPEPDDNKAARETFPDENLKVNEYLFRRVDLEDVVSAHLAAAERARAHLGWKPKYDFNFLVEQLKTGKDTRSPLARLVGSKGYHANVFAEGPYPTLRE